MEQPLVSIIIPVYNGEKYLRPCIESILHQSYQNWELLLIDDGSHDRSGAICDEYSADPRITAIHKQNGGQAAARNRGVSMAKGEYISFIDCDDWLEPDMYEQLINTLQEQQAEVVICGYYEEYTTRTKEVNNDAQMTCYNSSEALKMILENKFGSYLWSMLFHRSVVQESMPNLNPYEDHATVFKWISHAKRVVVWHHAFYHYRQLQSSSMHSYNPTDGNHFFLAVKERYYYTAEKKLLPGWEQQNRKLYIQSCIKATKDLARMPHYNQEIQHNIEDIRNELYQFLPIKLQEVGIKYWIRLHLLMANVNTYVRILRLSSIFSLGKRRKEKSLIP